MALAELPLPPEIWAATPCPAQALILAQRERIRDLEARRGRRSSESSRPLSADLLRGSRRSGEPSENLSVCLSGLVTRHRHREPLHGGVDAQAAVPFVNLEGEAEDLAVGDC